MDDIVISVIAIAALVYLLKRLLFPSKNGIIAFDLGGVLTKGDYLVGPIEEREGMRETIKQLKKNYKVVLLSNQNSEVHSIMEKKLGLPKLFDGQIVSGRVGVKKPDTKIFNLLLRSFNARPEKTIFIDDDAGNVDAAKKAGIKGIQFVSLSQMISDLRKAGVKV